MLFTFEMRCVESSVQKTAVRVSPWDYIPVVIGHLWASKTTLSKRSIKNKKELCAGVNVVIYVCSKKTNIYLVIEQQEKTSCSLGVIDAELFNIFKDDIIRTCEKAVESGDYETITQDGKLIHFFMYKPYGQESISLFADPALVNTS